MNFNPVKKQE